jgi:hypothetical protein
MCWIVVVFANGGVIITGGLMINVDADILAWHYGSANKELEFIINYDIKYWMEQDAGKKSGE